MKMPKLKFDKATLQEFFLLHVEKIVLGVVVILLILFVYWGTQLDRMKDDLKSPKQLQELADRVRKSIEDQGNWPRIAPERKVDYDTKVIVETSVTQDIFPGMYPGGRFDPGVFPRHRARTDPKAFPPKNLTAIAIVGPLAKKRDPMAGVGGERPMAGTLRDDPLSDTVPTTNTVGGASGYGGYGEGPLMRREDADKKKTEKKKMPVRPNPRGPKNPGGPGPGPRDEDFGIEHAPGGPGPGPGMATTAEGPRKFERDCGFVPSADCTWITGRAVVVQAVVPWQKQFDEYRRCLEEAADFRLDRDLPNYMTYLVERADVTANPEADPKTLKWATPLMADGRTPYTTSKAREETWWVWSGFPAEILDADFLDVELTHPAPPFMMRDLTEIMKHPDVPVASDEVLVDPSRRGPVVQYDEFGNPLEVREGVLPRNPGDGAQARTRSAFTHKMPSTTGPGGERPIYNGVGGQETIEHAEQKVRQYKLIRFTDVTVVPGRVYRYRIKVVLEDPNHPKELAKDPAISSLEDPVKLRIKQVADKETQRNNRRIFWVESDWSEASPPVTLPDIEGYFASGVQQSTPQTVRPDRPPLPGKAPTGKMVEVTWDSKHCVDVPVVVNVERGSSINFSGEAQVIHPVEGQIRKIEEFSLHRPSVVAEVDGGVSIPPASAAHGKPLVSPGEMLVFDERGNWHMLNESRDVEGVHRHILDDALLKDPDPNAPKPPPAAGTPTTRPPPGRE